MNDPKVFIKYSNDIKDVYISIEEYNPVKERKVLTVLHDLITDMMSNKKLHSVVTDLFIRGQKLNISVVLTTQLNVSVTKDVRRNTTYLFIMSISSRGELKQIAINHSSDIDSDEFKRLYRKYTARPYSY